MTDTCVVGLDFGGGALDFAADDEHAATSTHIAAA